jgi:hypothetical protein
VWFAAVAVWGVDSALGAVAGAAALVAVDAGTVVGVSGLLIGIGAVLLGRFPGGIGAAVRHAGDWPARPAERPATRRLSPAGHAVAARVRERRSP